MSVTARVLLESNSPVSFMKKKDEKTLLWTWPLGLWVSGGGFGAVPAALAPPGDF